MAAIFCETNFDGNIENWNIAKVENMYHIFYQSPLEKNPPKWYNSKKLQISESFNFDSINTAKKAVNIYSIIFDIL
jgi:hypothetical protein